MIKVKIQIRLLFIFISIVSISCNRQMILQTVDKLDLNKYQGKWYEIARLPNNFEKGLTAVTATYSLNSNGKVNVLNQGIKSDNKLKSINGTAWVPDKNYPGRLKVRFFWPFSGKYYVIKIDNNYRYALVGSPSRKFLWVLSKDIEMPDDVYDEYLELAKEVGFDVENLVTVDQRVNRKGNDLVN